MAEHMSFLIPTIRGIEDTPAGNLLECIFIRDTNEYNDDDGDDDDTEEAVSAIDEIPTDVSMEPTSIEKLPPPPPPPPANTTHKIEMKKERTQFDADFLEWQKMKKKETYSRTAPDTDEMFFLSILPDLKKLSETRKRSFKVEIMNRLHNMLVEDDEQDSS